MVILRFTHLLLVFSFLVVLPLNAQTKQNKIIKELAVELQFYPAGFITSVRAMKALSSKDAMMFRLGYNAATRQNFGEHDDEHGGGPGCSIGYRHYFGKKRLEGLFAAARLGLWFMDIKWKDETVGLVDKGSTFITVLQPTLAGGYQHVFNDRWSVGVSLAFGIEWNIITRGEEVGQGGISIFFLSVGRRF